MCKEVTLRIETRGGEMLLQINLDICFEERRDNRPPICAREKNPTKLED